jgi:hypothetical protein
MTVKAARKSVLKACPRHHVVSAFSRGDGTLQIHLSGLADLILFLVMNAVKKLFRPMQFRAPPSILHHTNARFFAESAKIVAAIFPDYFKA